MLLVLAAGGLVWAAVIAVSGGIVLDTGWGRISSRNPVKPFVIGGLALTWYVAFFRRHAWTDLRRTSVVRRPQVLAALLVATALVIGVRWGTFVASSSDASGYVSQADLWLRGELTTPAPEWVRDAPWRDAAWSSAPLGYRPSGISYAIVPTYSPGLPVMMALLQALGGREAVYYVVPCLGALTVWITYLLGVRFGGPWAGILAGILMLTSPTFLVMLVQPLSDVPAAALWAVALWAASRASTASAAGAGAATALAIAIRPNIAPLAAVIALIVAWRPLPRFRDLLWFGAAAAPGAVAIALLNAHLYGSPLSSGYGSPGVLYSIDRVWPNLVIYTRWLLESETPLMLLGLGAPFLVAATRTDTRLVTLIAVVFPLAVLASYLAYFVFDVWWYLRFLLPAYAPLLAATGAVIVGLIQSARRPAAAMAAAALVAAVALHGLLYSDAFILERNEQRYVRVADYVRRLPERAVFVSLLHSGSIRYYTGRDVLRWEVVDPASFDTAIAYLRARGHDVYLVADDGDVAGFKERFASTRTVRDLARTLPADLGGVRVFAVAGSSPVLAPPGW